MNKRSRPAPPPPPPHKKPVWLLGGIAVVIAIALGIAIWSASGSGKVSQGTVGTDAAGRASSSPAETQPVTTIGTPLPPEPASGADPAVGLKAPTLLGFTFDGTPIDITPGSGGRAKMVVFLAHWCPHCNREIPVILQWAAAGLPANLDIVGVSTGVSAQRDNYPPSKWIVSKGWKWPVMADSSNSDGARAYGLAAYPTFDIIGADGTVKLRSSGELAQADLDTLVKQALAS
jgi:cytochrome c biogenesis protein CcmG/thiol:disulfide interchange protein DsbE